MLCLNVSLTLIRNVVQGNLHKKLQNSKAALCSFFYSHINAKICSLQPHDVQNFCKLA